VNFEEFLEKLSETGLDLRARGFINVEGGSCAVTSSILPWCDCSSSGFVGPKAGACQECGRAPGNFVSIPAGEGDGVYVVFEIHRRDDEAQNVGALVVFDHGYAIANEVRSAVSSQKWPEVPTQEFENFGNSRSHHLASFDTSERIWIGDSPIAQNDKKAFVDVSIHASAKTEMFTFASPLSQDEAAVEARLSEMFRVSTTEARSFVSSTKAMFEVAAEGKDWSEESPFPNLDFRVLVALDNEVSSALGLLQNQESIEWELLSAQVACGMGTSHVEPQHDSAMTMNVRLAIERDRNHGESISESEVKQLLFEVWTWALQGVALGDGGYLPSLENAYVPTAAEVSELLERRGAISAANDPELVSRILRKPDPYALSRSGGGFGSSGSDSGLSKQSAKPKAKFCSNCGTQFGSSLELDCSTCGVARG